MYYCMLLALYSVLSICLSAYLAVCQCLSVWLAARVYVCTRMTYKHVNISHLLLQNYYAFSM